ncbi:hypothetical protein Poly30_54240 [Planctomycetes bacterium Poly30]|uniref:Uncharacterized protein n=1 Tax=Saltatorellus ferox TaxID=2528018 RepID=A0A518F0K9_9BACT|nr:hypothetical protein Poly30_54240 [Planctomycetes bacterium Poly30]
MLLTQEDVSAFGAFNQADFDPTSYDLAFRLRCNDPDVIDQPVDLVLLSETQPILAMQIHTKFPLLAGGSDDGPSSETDGDGVDCSPAQRDEPQPSFSGACSFPEIASFPTCPDAGPVGQPACNVWPEEVSRVCGTAGNDGTAVFTRTETGGVSVAFQGVGANGSVSSTATTTMNYDLDDGECGTCQTFYWMRQRCTQVFEYWVFTVKIYESIHPLAVFMYSQIGCFRKTITLACTNDYGPSASAVCLRTGCN